MDRMLHGPEEEKLADFRRLYTEAARLVLEKGFDSSPTLFSEQWRHRTALKGVLCKPGQRF